MIIQKLTEKKFTDHDFAAYLKSNDWKNKIDKIKTGTIAESDFVTDNGKLIAKVLYDNEKSTHRIFLPEKEQKQNKAIKYEIVNHGPCNPSYFQGCGTTYTEYDTVATGIGNDAKEAYNDAIEQLYMMDIDSESLDKLFPKQPKGIRKSDCLPESAGLFEYYWHVSVRIKFAE